jgi:hypothetical protein
MRVPCPEGCDQAEYRKSWNQESVGETTQAHKENSVYRTLPGSWQSIEIPEQGNMFQFLLAGNTSPNLL